MVAEIPKLAGQFSVPWLTLSASWKVKRSKIKVTSTLNTVTENQPYLRNGKVYELQTSYTDEYDDTHHRHAQ